VQIPWGDSVVYRYFMLARRRTLIAVLPVAHGPAPHPRIWRRPGRGPARHVAAPEESCLLSTGGVTARSRHHHHRSQRGRRPAPRSVSRANDAERIVFRPPVRLAGAHRLRRAMCVPGLVDRWEKDDGGHRWTFPPARGGAQFWDGAPRHGTGHRLRQGRCRLHTRSAREKCRGQLTFAKGNDDVFRRCSATRAWR